MRIEGLSFVVVSIAVACTAPVDSGPPSGTGDAPGVTSSAHTPLAQMQADHAAFATALTAAGYDPEKVEAEARAITSMPDGAARTENANEWKRAYGAFIAPHVDKIDSALWKKPLPSDVSSPMTLRGNVSANPYTSCPDFPVSIRSPWDAGWPRADSRESGIVSVNELAGGFYDHSGESGVRGSIEVEASEAEVTITGDVDVHAYAVQAYSLPPFTYARAGIGLRITVRSGSTVLCQQDKTLRDETFLGAGSGALGVQQVKCNFLKEANITALTVDVSVRGWVTTAGVETHALADIGGDVLRMSTIVCTEPGVMTNHEGACIEPAGTTVAGHGIRSSECDGGANQHWRMVTWPLGTIRSEENPDLCISHVGSWVTLARCNGSAAQSWILFANGWVKSQDPTLVDKCLQSSAMGSLLTLATCEPHNAQQFLAIGP